MQIGHMLRQWLIRLEWFDTLFPRIPVPIQKYIMDELRMQGVSRPTSIQSMTWPALYAGRDMMCIGLPTHSRVVSV